MNKDVRIGTNYPIHPKTRKLKKALGAEGVMSHIFLLCFVAQTTPSGTLKDMSPEDIAWAAQWRGDPDKFVDTLVEVRLLDKRGDTYAIHNWPKHNYFAMTAPIRSEIARRNINKRWEKKTKSKQANNTDRNTGANRNSNTQSNSPSPSPSPSLEMDDGVRGDSETSTLEATPSQSPREERDSSGPSVEDIQELAHEVSREHDYPALIAEISDFLNNGVSLSRLFFALTRLRLSEPKGSITHKVEFRKLLKKIGDMPQKRR